jgi:membrane peptidoglycan carboxypeptidase
MIKTVTMLPPQRLYEYIRAFGFGSLTGIDLPGEVPGILHPPSRWSGLSMASMTIGQEIGVTALQLGLAFSTIANDGVFMRPYVVSQVRDPNGAIIEENGPQAVRRVMRSETAEQLARMLERVITDGTGTAARIDGYRCAGKTGTAQKPDLKNGGYHRDKYVAVFAGFVPADDPVACIVIMADSPKGKYYGGQVAAPAFKKIAQEILNRYEIAPSEPEQQMLVKSVKSSKTAGQPRRKPEAAGTIVIDEHGRVHMPNVMGMTMQSIVKTLSPYVDQFEFTGSGVACQQTPAPNEPIASGHIYRITFRRIDEE